MRKAASLCALLSANILIAQVEPCSPVACDLKKTTELCRIAGEGAPILLTTPQGQQCACECPKRVSALGEIPSPGDLVSAFDARKRAWNMRFSRAAADITPCSQNALRFVVNQDGDLQACAGARQLCPRDLRAAHLANRVIDALAARVVVEADSVVQRMTFESQYRAERFPSYFPPNGTMNIPADFLDHDLVGDELLLFYFLHEAAHAYDNGYTELQSDMWAVHEGLLAFSYGRWSAEHLALIRERMACQFKAYYTSVYRTEALPSAINSNGAIYDCMECRAAVIRGTYTVAANGLPESCASDTIVDDPDLYLPPNEPRPGCRSMCETCPSLDAIPLNTLYGSTRLDVSIPEEICAVSYPLCQLDPVTVLASFEQHNPRIARSIRRLNKAKGRVRQRASGFKKGGNIRKDKNFP